MSKSLRAKISSGSEMLIKNPKIVVITLNAKGYKYTYQCIKVNDINSVLVNGKTLINESASSEIISKTFS